MKKHLSSVMFGCIGLCVGFTLCYVYLVLPKRAARANPPQWIALQARNQLDWRPYVIEPMIPPRIVGK